MQRFDSLIQSYRFLAGLVTKNRPIYLHVAVTHRCNLRCRMCAAWKLADPSNEATPRQFGDLAKVFAKLGCMQVSLGGGEPFMRKDLPEIIAAFAANQIRVRVLTNGVAPTRTSLEAAVQAGMTDVSISLDSLNPALQAMIDGAEDTLNQKFETLTILNQTLPPRSGLPMLNTVVSRYNLEELHALVDFAEQVGLTISLIPIHIAKEFGDGDRFKTYAPDMKPRLTNKAEVARLYRELILRKHRGAPIMNSTAFLELSAAYFAGEVDRFPCDAGRLYFSVSPQGETSICHDFEGRQRLPSANLETLRGTADYETTRRSLIDHCSGCIRPCWAETTYLVNNRRALWELGRTMLRKSTKDRITAIDQLKAAAVECSERK